MITFYTEMGNPIQIPTSFYDITVREFLLMTSEGMTDLSIVEALTGLNEEQLAVIDLEPIMEALEFMRSGSIYESIEPGNFISVNEKDIAINENLIMKGTWGQKIHGTDLLKEGKMLDLLCLYLYPKFYGTKKSKPISEKKIESMRQELMPLSVQEVYSCVNFVANQLISVLETDRRMLSVKPTSDQIEAKIEIVVVLGEFNSIDLLANGNPLLYKDIEALPYEIIFPKLVKNTISTKFERNLRALKPK